MARDVTLSAESAAALAAFVDAFVDAFDLHTTGVWAGIKEAMRDDFGIDDPEEALRVAREELAR